VAAVNDVHTPGEPPESPDNLAMEWARLRTDYLRERVAQSGSPEDHVALARALLQLHSTGVPGALDEAVEVLDLAAARHPRSVAVWEYVAFVSTVSGRLERQAKAYSVLEQLDPGSQMLALASSISEEDEDEWASQAWETQRVLLDQVLEGDEAQVEAALSELERWARFSPTNSMYAVNLALALMSAGRRERACDAARAGWAVEDGSFADAYNVALVLTHCGEPDAARTIGSIAVTRAGSDEERALVSENLGVGQP